MGEVEEREGGGETEGGRMKRWLERERREKEKKKEDESDERGKGKRERQK